ncbi:MAG TPA: hypothetical protein VGG72_06515 [Bryobacteraceae bacterium]|jgi:hypothetical protein
MNPAAKLTAQDLRPFARLAKYLPDSFVKEAVELLFLVREYGISKNAAPLATSGEYLDFVAQTHDGWKTAQRRIAALMTTALTKRAEEKAARKDCRRRRDKPGEDAAKRAIWQFDLELKVLQRTLDVILWTIFSGDHSSLRRLFVVGGKHNLSVQNIADALPTAEQFNEDPYTVALCTDMLSSVHVGDLLVANRRTGDIAFVELKAGDKNYGISKIAEVAVLSGCGSFEHIMTANFDETDAKQYERAKRQIERNRTILSTIKNEGGRDPNIGAQVTINAVEDPPELWCSEIMSCYEQLDDSKSWAIATVDKCVHVGVYSEQNIAIVGFKSWMDELKCDSPIYNLADSFYIPSSRPLGATFLSLELQTKVLRGETLIIICLDILRLIEMANQMRPGLLSLGSRADSAKTRGFRMQTLELNGRLIKISTGGDQLEFLGGGFRDRVVFDQQSPSQLIRYHIGSLDLESSGGNG